MRKASWSERVALIGLILLIGASALAFGSVEPWAGEWLRFGALTILGAILWRRDPGKVFGGAAGALLLPGGLLLLWALVQVVPLPAPAIRLLSPRTAAMHEQAAVPGGGSALPAWLLAKAKKDGTRLDPATTVSAGPADPGDRTVGKTLSVYPYATRGAALTWLTLLLLFTVAARLSAYEILRYRLLWGISLWTGIMGLLAVVQRLTGSDEILWLREKPSGSLPLGPFVNPDHFAGFVEMGTLVAIGLLLALLSRTTGRLDWRGVRTAVLDRDWAFPRLLVVGAVILLGVIGLVLSMSRGGWLGFALGSLFLILARTLSRRWAAMAVVGVIVFGLVVGVADWLILGSSGSQVAPFVSLGTDASVALRLDAWSDTLRIWTDYPITGAGLGTFRWVFASYQRAGEWEIWSQAHNDYLQLLSETGVVGLLLLVWALVVFLRKILLPALRPSDERPRWTTVATAGAVFAMLAHTVVDFNLQIPAVAALFAVALGILAGASRDAAGAGRVVATAAVPGTNDDDGVRGPVAPAGA